MSHEEVLATKGTKCSKNNCYPVLLFVLYVPFCVKQSVAGSHKGERLFTKSLAIVLGVRYLCRAWGVCQCDASLVYDFTRPNISEIFFEGWLVRTYSITRKE
jgi:hypothetical protein